tara:strand:+ start:856 stop:1596 length:741 start_codon:yes stop_codon:yes gene_type:complete
MPGALDFQPYERHVQQGMVDGQYASGAFTMIAAGPPRLANLGRLGGGDIATASIAQPIGMVQNIGLSHNRQFSRIFELGSERAYYVSGRTQGQLSLSRVYYHGPSLLRMLYAAKQDTETPVVVPPFTALSTVAAAMDPNPHNVKIRPGFNNLYLNLASDLFSQPIGLLIKTVDSNEDTIGAVYAEACYVPNHSFSTDANGLLVQEQASIVFERVVPVRVNAVSLIESAAEASLGAIANSTRTTGEQ